MKKILISLLCGFLAMVAVGCGDSSNDYVGVAGQQGPAGRTPSGSIAVNLSQADLSTLFSAQALAQGTQPIDPRIASFYLFAYDAAGNLVGSTAGQAINNIGLSLAIQGLQVLGFDVVLAGVDRAGNVVGAYQAENIFPVPNGVREIAAQAFYPIEGFVLPSDRPTPPTPVENIDVSVSFSGNIPQITFTGGNAFSVTAVPEDLIEAYETGNVGIEDFARIYTRASTNGTDALSSPTLLNSEIIGGTTTNLLFEGFEEGIDYQISVTRSNGEFGYIFHPLVP